MKPNLTLPEAESELQDLIAEVELMQHHEIPFKKKVTNFHLKIMESSAITFNEYQSLWSKMKPLYLFCSLLLFLCFKSNAQITVTNNGMAIVSITPGTTVSILGNYVSQTKSGVDGKIDNQGTIQITGDWTNNNISVAPYSPFSSASGTIMFNGTGLQNIQGANTTTFFNLTINKITGELKLN